MGSTGARGAAAGICLAGVAGHRYGSAPAIRPFARQAGAPDVRGSANASYVRGSANESHTIQLCQIKPNRVQTYCMELYYLKDMG